MRESERKKERKKTQKKRNRIEQNNYLSGGGGVYAEHFASTIEKSQLLSV